MALNQQNSPFDPAEVLTTDRLEAKYNDIGCPMLNNYFRYAKVGGGQHGEVYLCHRLDSKLPPDHPEYRHVVAMKSVKRDNPRAERLKQLRKPRIPHSTHTPMVDKLNTTEAKIRKEIAIMKKCRHPHVVRLYEVIDDRLRDKIYMVMEYLAGGEVKWRNDDNEPLLTVEQTRRVMRDAVLGLEYLHYQGIIHRDIKPANLLWTEDRRQVKIGDFGVSHFSYAQRLAAAGKDGDKDPHDPILLDDSDLTRRAGTPSFLAPEVVYEHTHSPSSPSESSIGIYAVASSSTVASVRPRPPITKAIDIWALGVTLYCLLFGRTPFFADPSLPSSEWSLYNSICNNDWEPLPTMGFDRIPTGGRHPPDDDSEGSMVMDLLVRFLEKDVTQRITLDEVKRSPWLLHGLLEPEKWLEVTSPTYKIDVSKAETSKAMSNVRFSWNWGAMRRIFSNLRPGTRQRQPNSKRRRQGDDGRGPVMSDPQLNQRRRRRRHTSAKTQRVPISQETSGRTPLARSYERLAQMNKTPTQDAVRSKSIDRWYASIRTAAASAVPLQGPSSVARRDSAGTIPSSPTESDRPRRKLAQFLASLWSSSHGNKTSPQACPAAPVSPPPGRHRSGTTSSGPPMPLNTQPRSMVSFRKGKGKASRRSEEALRHHAYYKPQAPASGFQNRSPYSQQNPAPTQQHQPVCAGGSGPSNASGPLTAARRASSWGYDFGEYADVVSVRSDGVELNDHDMIVGAGGVANDMQALMPRNTSGRALTPAAAALVYSASRTVAGPPPNRVDGGRVSFYDEVDRERFGPPALDDTSTIASASEFPSPSTSGEWQCGGDLNEREEFFDSPEHLGQDGSDGEKNADDGDEDEHEDGHEDESSDEENRVTFSPRRHNTTSRH